MRSLINKSQTSIYWKQGFSIANQTIPPTETKGLFPPTSSSVAGKLTFSVDMPAKDW